MKASALEYRLRFWLHALILVLGFWAPWTYLQRTNELEVTRGSANVWIVLSTNLSLYLGPTRLLFASNIILALAVLFAALGAWLRTWGAAYLDSNVVQSGTMHTASTNAGFLEVGPFRHLRNPLYLGTFLHVIALSILMPRSGAIFAIAAVALLDVRLVEAEESFLSHSLGQPYDQYCERVPSFFPTFRDRTPASAHAPAWGQAFLGEFYMWGVVATFLFEALAASAFPELAYTQSYALMGVLLSLGVSLLIRGLLLKPKSTAT